MVKTRSSAAAARSAASAKTPAAQRLPLELWLAILDEADYCDLKRLGRVCKKLKRITACPSRSPPVPGAADDHALPPAQDHPHFAVALFKQGPSDEPLDEDEDAEIHPLLERTNCVFPSLRPTQWRRRDEAERAQEARQALQYKAVDEYATSPACTKMVLDMDTPPTTWTFERVDGITIRDVLEELDEFWQLEPVDMGDDAWIGYQTHFRALELCNGNVWNGWYGAMVQRDGSVVLNVNDYTVD
ncbi:hypothetical protein JCM10450v2_005939 [Rhodotorula kratochvilovae]